jgi:predicted phage terminase large subunit-like protein
MIKHYFGDFRQRDVNKHEFEEVFSKKAWVAYDSLIWPRGAGQQVRGVLFKNDRPGLIVIDDLEDPKEIENPEIRKSQFQWLYADVLKAVPRLHRNWKIVYIDTLKHEDSILQKLLSSPDWESVRLEACDDNFKSTAPHFISDDEIMREWEEHQSAGQTDVFFRELRNLPISTKDASFKKEYFHYYNLPLSHPKSENDIDLTDAEIFDSKTIETVVILDPAKTVKIHSAESAILGVGIDLQSAKLYIRDAISEKMYPDEIYSALFGMAINLGAKAVGVEVTSLNEFIKQPIKNEMFKRGKFFEFIWLNARGGKKKELRIKELVPYYRLGYIYHNASCATIKKLESQLMMFPRSALWDLMDCEAYIIEMLELGDRYFSPTLDEENAEAEYKELEYDNPVEGWRYA